MSSSSSHPICLKDVLSYDFDKSTGCFFSTILLNITLLKMGFIVVQWENENSVSVANEKKVVGAVELKEGTINS